MWIMRVFCIKASTCTIVSNYFMLMIMADYMRGFETNFITEFEAGCTGVDWIYSHFWRIVFSAPSRWKVEWYGSPAWNEIAWDLVREPALNLNCGGIHAVTMTPIASFSQTKWQTNSIWIWFVPAWKTGSTIIFSALRLYHTNWGGRDYFTPMSPKGNLGESSCGEGC